MIPMIPMAVIEPYSLPPYRTPASRKPPKPIIVEDNRTSGIDLWKSSDHRVFSASIL
jgi:hypothetical protein